MLLRISLISLLHTGYEDFLTLENLPQPHSFLRILVLIFIPFRPLLKEQISKKLALNASYSSVLLQYVLPSCTSLLYLSSKSTSASATLHSSCSSLLFQSSTIGMLHQWHCCLFCSFIQHYLILMNICQLSKRKNKCIG